MLSLIGLVGFKRLLQRQSIKVEKKADWSEWTWTLYTTLVLVDDLDMCTFFNSLCYFSTIFHACPFMSIFFKLLGMHVLRKVTFSLSIIVYRYHSDCSLRTWLIVYNSDNLHFPVVETTRRDWGGAIAALVASEHREVGVGVSDYRHSKSHPSSGLFGSKKQTEWTRRPYSTELTHS